jgi:Peptidase A4 family
VVRRWYIPLLALPVAAGTLVALAAGVASASPGLPHPAPPAVAVQSMAVHPVSPGSPMIRPSGAAVPGLRGDLNAPTFSTNWAGYAVASKHLGAFRGVSARWIEPRATCRSRVHALAAFWVGLDGFNSNSVEQTGADSDCFHGTPTYYGWYEMFPAAPVFFRTKVNPGDHMSASVTFRGTRTYVLVLRDNTRRWTHTIIKNEGGLSRTSAEVIAEAPSELTSHGPVVLPLANFGTIRWTGSRVNGVLLRRLARTRIVMAEPRPSHLFKALTSLVSSADIFTNTWVRSS